MKRVAFALCGAGFYFGIYFMAQIAVSYVYTMGFMVIAMVKAMLENPRGYLAFLRDKAAYEALMNGILEDVMANSVQMLAISLLLTVFFLWISFVIRRKSLLAETECRGIKWSTAGMATALGLCASCAVQVIFSVIPFPESWMDSYVDSSSTLTDAPLWLMTVASVILAPIVEELIFRGLVYTRLRRVMPIPLACALVSILFGVMHGTVIWFIYTCLLSILMVAMFERTGSLLTPILIHFGFNLCGTFLGYLIGNEISMLELILLAVIGICGTVGLSVLVFLFGKKSFAACEPRPETPSLDSASF